MEVANLIVVSCLSVGCVIFYGYINYFRIVIELKKSNKDVTWSNLFLFRSFSVFHVKYNLDAAYPNSEVYKLSKRYDKLVPYYYLSLVAIIVLVFIMIGINKTIGEK
jgi:hypothetical protein